MIGCIESNLPIENINERIDVIVDYWNGSCLKTITVETITDNYEVLADNGGIYELVEVSIYDLAWLCTHYCKN